MKNNNEIQFPYGAVYFRKSNPPREVWEEDYKRAARNGVNVFRHWMLWGSVETKRGEFDWEDYDKQLELSEKYNIRCIFTLRVEEAPEWLYRSYPESLHKDFDGNLAQSLMGGSSATGGNCFGNAGSVCLDTEIGKELVGSFIKELVNRYKDHPAFWGYDVWNESHSHSDVCYCDSTREVFLEWLKNKYESIEVLRNNWHRYTLSCWDDVNIPKTLGPYPDCEDWLEFRILNFHKQRDWKIEQVKKYDKNCLIAAHGVAGSIRYQDELCCNEWMASEPVDVYGVTWVASRKGNASWLQYHAMDLTRSGSNGKPIWHAEAQGGPLWLQRQCQGRAKADGRVTEAEDVRLWHMVSLAAGIRGILFPRWRPLLDGPLFGAFGVQSMDGSNTDRSIASKKIADWANDEKQKQLMLSKPVLGDVGILLLETSQTMDYLLSKSGGGQFYYKAVEGAYQGFFSNNIQADFITIADITKYSSIYLPMPIGMRQNQADDLFKWVEDGGTLISEGLPGYFGKGCKANIHQPGFGLDKLFGVKQKDVEFMPDIANETEFDFDGQIYHCGGFIQKYDAEQSKVRGRDKECNPIVVENSYGNGKTILLGSSPSIYLHDGGNEIHRLYKQFFLYYDKKQHVEVFAPNITARISKNCDKSYVWITNPGRNDSYGRVKLNCKFRDFTVLYGNGVIKKIDNILSIKVNARDGLVIELK